MSWQQAVERTVTGMGYELVDTERIAGGLLRISIDRVPGQVYPTGESEFVLVEDCEIVTRQLQRVLEVETCDYARLEVSSPGLDRPLRRDADFRRFAGLAIELTLKAAFQGRKHYRGDLRLPEGADAATATTFELVFRDGQDDKVLGFEAAEVREARLVPVVDFKGRRRGGAAAAQPTTAAPDGAGHAAQDSGEQKT